MNFSETIGILRQRKWTLIPMLLLTVVLVVAAFVKTPALYEANSSLVLLAPTQVIGEAADTVVNPFLNFGGSQDTAAQVLQARMGDDLIAEALADQGVDGEWTFEIQGGGGPLGIITVQEDSSKAAIKSAGLIAASAQEQFVQMQVEAGSPAAQLISLKNLTTPNTTETVNKNKVRNAAAVGAAMLLLTLGLIFGLEGISRSRRRNTAPHSGADDSGATATGGRTEPAAESASDAAGSAPAWGSTPAARGQDVPPFSAWPAADDPSRTTDMAAATRSTTSRD